jgi:hypothetical protein
LPLKQAPGDYDDIDDNDDNDDDNDDDIDLTPFCNARVSVRIRGANGATRVHGADGTKLLAAGHVVVSGDVFAGKALCL